MIAQAQALGDETGRRSRSATSTRSTLPDASFDVVHAHQVLQHLTDPVAAVGEAHRVLRPDGVLAVRDSDYAAFFWAPANPRLDRWLELYHQLTPRNRAEADAGRHLAAWVRAGGFSDVDRHELELDVRRRRRTGVVGRHVGRPRPAVGVRHPGHRRTGCPSEAELADARGRLARVDRRAATASSSSRASRSSPAADIHREAVRRVRAWPAAAYSRRHETLGVRVVRGARSRMTTERGPTS